MGTGFAMVNGHASYVDLIEIPKGSLPPMSFTWANNVLPEPAVASSDATLH